VPCVGGMGRLRRAAWGDSLLEMFFSSPVKQFSKEFPWNVLTLEFKVSAADVRGVGSAAPKLLAGDCVCGSDGSAAPGHAVQ